MRQVCMLAVVARELRLDLLLLILSHGQDLTLREAGVGYAVWDHPRGAVVVVEATVHALDVHH